MEKSDNNMKVVFISHVSGLGGAERSLLELVRGLNNRNIDCYVILPTNGPLVGEFEKIPVPVSIIHLPWSADGEKKYDANRIGEIGKSTLGLVDLLRDIKPDVVYTNSSVVFQGAIAAHMLGIKHIWHIREFGEEDYGIDFYLPIKERARFIYEYSDKIIFISNALKEYYHRYISNEKSELVYNNVKIPEHEKIAITKNNDKLKLLIVGNVQKGKGQLDAVKAVKKLKDQGIENIKLDILGIKSSGYYAEILDYINKNNLVRQICFFDFIDNPANFFQETDVVLMCSKSEGFGRVTVEAMLFEKPVIGARAGGTVELVKNGENGLLYESGNSDDLAKKIVFFYENRDKIVEYGKNGRLFCESTFTEEKYSGKIYGILAELIDKREYLSKNMLLSVFDEIKLYREVLTGELSAVKDELSSVRLELSKVYTSREWKIAIILQKVVKMLFPKGSSRRKIAESTGMLIKRVLRFVLRFRKTIRAVLRYCLFKFGPRSKRKISKKSKKLVYVGHSYHNKTKSTVFLTDYLKKFYDLEIILDESWIGKPFPDLSFIDEDYLGVVFFQNLPDVKVLRRIKNDNIIFFPMYDGVPHDFAFWSQQYNLKIVNFSKTLHRKLSRWGIESMFVQYFPKPQSFIPGNKDEIFFWQRLTRMSVDLVSKLLGETKVKMHIHRAIDPNQQFKHPSNEQESRYEIMYSDWFETREEMWGIIKQKGIYIAPREFEGIGMSFLEAMAMGKAVIAVDNPTMNEYIIHGKNGYLFDLNNPTRIDLSDIEQVQKNAHAFMCEGYEKWEKEKRTIIDFIEKE